MKVGYVRISDKSQNTARQDILMEQLEAERVFTDKCSGKNIDRPQLKEMLVFVREGDCLVVESFSRLARSTRDLLDIVAELDKKNVKFISQKENIDTATPNGRFMLTIFAALATLEREVLLERQREGIACAKAEGKYKGGKPKPTDWEQFAKLYKKWKAGELTAVSMQKKMGMTAPTFYRRVREFEGKKEKHGL